eukprot:2602703-Rhodomonas_salina.1
MAADLRGLDVEDDVEGVVVVRDLRPSLVSSYGSTVQTIPTVQRRSLVSSYGSTVQNIPTVLQHST